MEQVFTLDTPDDMLVKICQSGHNQGEESFKELFSRYQNLIWRLCYSFTHNQEDAEDLMQEVFIKAYRNLPQFEFRSSFKTWICRIAVNTCQNELRRRSRRPQVTDIAMDVLVNTLPSEDNPEEILQQKTKRQQLAAAMAELRPEEFQALQMKDLDQLPYSEIASLLGIGLSAAKMRVRRARLAFQQVYA